MRGEFVSCSDPTKFKPNSDSMHDVMRLIEIASQMIQRIKHGYYCTKIV